MEPLERADETYRKHHLERSAEFVFAGGARVSLFRAYVGGPGRRVLDVGCRYGALTRHYLAGNEVVGVDVDSDALARAAELGIETVWADADADLPFEDASFDVVVLGEVLEHIRLPQLLLREARRTLRPGGTLVGSVPNAYRLKNRLRFLAGRPPETDPTHLHIFRVSDARHFLDGLDAPRVHLIEGRLARLGPPLFANDIVFSGRKPR